MAEDTGWELKWDLLVADCWDDPALKKRLLTDTAAVLKERGINVPAGTTIKVVEDTSSTTHLVLPEKPAEGELSESELENVAGGHCIIIGCGRGCGGGCGCGRGCGRGCGGGCGCGRGCGGGCGCGRGCGRGCRP
ncbi:MAG: NHLP leader peptide family RiPP precursor [Planctomycetaceae bacterium]|nr:NHLP leader peptide family RiPP precursor [Planctomycetaceae bacterium]